MKYIKLEHPIIEEGEIFKVCPGIERYEISNLGNFRSKKYMFNKKLKTTSAGYKEATVKVKGKNISHKIHRLVLFAHNPVEGMNKLWVNHKNHNRGDNRLENLEWVTPRENAYHKQEKESDFITKTVGIQKTRKRDYTVKIYIGRYKTFEEANKVLLDVYNKLGLDTKYLERKKSQNN